jgi:NAD(P)-dependent dehydrogenase (short-subunit alcohol dehydrogenase family)
MSEMRLAGKVALVSDVQSGNGEAIARRFLAEGAQVAACPGGGTGVRREPDAVREERRRFGPRTSSLPPEILFLEGNVAAADEAKRIVDAVTEKYGRLDVLVNHGSGGRIVGTILDLSREEFDEASGGDVWSVIALSAAAIPVMVKGGGGAIVNITTIGRVGLKGRPLRATGGAAIGALTASMALDHGMDGIRVNSLLLGPAQSQELLDNPEGLKQILTRIGGHAPMGTLFTPEDVAAAALFLASDEARHITGAQLKVDAGRSLPNL